MGAWPRGLSSGRRIRLLNFFSALGSCAGFVGLPVSNLNELFPLRRPDRPIVHDHSEAAPDLDGLTDYLLYFGCAERLQRAVGPRVERTVEQGENPLLFKPNPRELLRERVRHLPGGAGIR